MQDVNFIEAVAERDIDLLLLEELRCAPEFREWFSSHALGQDADQLRFLGAWHSVTDAALGESDLLLLVQDPAGQRIAILIENKIDAIAQPEQATRYLQRGEKGRGKDHWDDFTTCIVAPERYLASVTDAALYKVQISYEEIRDWFLSKPDDERAAYRAKMIAEGIEQNRRGYSPVPHPAVTEFWRRYWMLAQGEYSSLEMKEPGNVPAMSDWPIFRPAQLGADKRIVHKWRQGYVDLELASLGSEVEELNQRLVGVLPKGAKIKQTGKSASVRMRVKEIDRFGDFESQLDRIREGLEAAKALLDLEASLPDLD